jgi:hypothetical protein
MNDFKFYRFYRLILSCVLFVSLAGCLEASFELAPESRLPKWLEVPKGVARSDLKVTMDYYSTFSGGKYVFKIYDKKKLIKSKKISLSTEEQPAIRTRELKKPGARLPNGYPAYNVVTVNGITDIVERRRMEPIFYMTDDPAVWKELGVEQ